MSQTGSIFPSASSQDSSGVAWTLLTNLYANDGASATTALNSLQVSNVVTLSGYDLSSLPDKSTIDGIEITTYINGSRGNGSVTASLSFSVGTSSTTFSTAYFGRSSTAAAVTLGGPTNQWGLTGSNLTGAGLKSSFSINMKAIASTSGSGTTATDVDYVSVVIYYTLNGNRFGFWFMTR